MGLSANEVEKLGSLKSDGPDVVKDVGLEDASYAPQTGMEYSQLYGSPYQVQQPGMDYYKSFEPAASAAPPPASAPPQQLHPNLTHHHQVQYHLIRVWVILALTALALSYQSQPDQW